MKKSTRQPLDFHAEHLIEIRPAPHPHIAKFHCVTCNKWMSWLTKEEAVKAVELNLITE